MAAPIQVSITPSQKIGQQLLDAANTVALEYAQNFLWSSWHSCNAVNQGKLDATPAFWDAIRPFGSCSGASTHISFALRDALAKHSNADVGKYVNNVKLMGCAQNALSEMQYHAIVALCFDTFAIVIDYVCYSTAFRVPLGGGYAMEPYVDLFIGKDQERFQYFLDEEDDFVLTIASVVKSSPGLSFSEMNVNAMVTQLGISTARELKALKDQPDISLPPRKYVSVPSLLDERPSQSHLYQ